MRVRELEDEHERLEKEVARLRRRAEPEASDGSVDELETRGRTSSRPGPFRSKSKKRVSAPKRSQDKQIADLGQIVDHLRRELEDAQRQKAGVEARLTKAERESQHLEKRLRAARVTLERVVEQLRPD